MLNNYAIYDLLIFNVPLDMLSLMHIALNHVVLSPNKLPPHITGPSLVNSETEQMNVMDLIKHANLYLSVYTCVCVSICMDILK